MCRPIYFCKLGQITIIYNRISFCVIDSHVKCSLLTNPNFGFNTQEYLSLNSKNKCNTNYNTKATKDKTECYKVLVVLLK